ncbi:MAG: HNH endonuclease signature motif containing protein [Burkholderiaceae bacterium]
MTRRPWTPDAIELLVALYPDNSTADIARRLGRAAGSCYQKAAALGLKKSAAFYASERAGRIQRGRQDPRMIASQFKPGLQPWNKGAHYRAGGRSAETRFKKGRRPQTWQPVGSLRINTDGYLDRKVSDTGRRDWVAVHRLVWQEAHGPIPAGHIVVFRPGRRSTVLEQITADALECITRAELARRNHPSSKSPELARLVQLKGAITRQVNRITREAEQAKEHAAS